MATIQLQDLYYSYGDGQQVLHGLSETVADGAFVCIVGPSGCGKTTLLRLIAGLQQPTAGQIFIADKPVTGPGTDRSIVFQNYTLFPWMTARKNVLFGVRQAQPALSKGEAAARADAFLEKVGLAGQGDKYPFQLSGGMRQRVAIARALAMDTDILLLDEPFGALDAKIREELQALIETLWYNGGAKRKTVLFVTHDIREAVQLADTILFMQPDGSVQRMDVELPRPRAALQGVDKEAYKRLCKDLRGRFDRREEAADEEA